MEASVQLPFECNNLIPSLLESSLVGSLEKEALLPYKNKLEIPIKLLRVLKSAILNLEKDKSKESKNILYNQIKGSKLIFPEKKKKEIDPELIKRREYLKLRGEEREYRKMISNVQEHQAKRIQQNDMQDVKQQMGVGINIMWVALSAFFIGFFLSKQVKKDETHFFNIVCGSFCFVGMLMIETILFLTRTIAYEKYSDKKPKTVNLFGKAAKPKEEEEAQKCNVL